MGLVQKAVNAYQKALALKPASLDAQTGLGVAYVSGTSNPMQGIQLLLGVVAKDPQNTKANMNLGLFSMKSGQFDKAVVRCKTVIAKKQDAEAWFYLASSYESLGQKSEAISAYEKSKELAGDPGLTKFVDDKVIELRKQREDSWIVGFYRGTKGKFDHLYKVIDLAYSVLTPEIALRVDQLNNQKRTKKRLTR